MIEPLLLRCHDYSSTRLRFELCGSISHDPPRSLVFSSSVITAIPSATSSATSLNVNIKVNVGEGEPIESALRRFKREVNKSGHLMELRHKRYFENSQEKKKRKIAQGRIRKRLERMQKRRMANRT